MSPRKRLGISTKSNKTGQTAPTEPETPVESAEAGGEPDAPASVGAASGSGDKPDDSTAPVPPASSSTENEDQKGAAVEDQEDDLLANFGGGLAARVDPLAPQPIDPARLPDSPEERLAAYEAAIESSQSTLAGTVMRAKFRAEVEIGFALDGIRKEELHIAKYGTIENYGYERWGYKRSTLYELMDTAPIRLVALSGKTVSGFPDTKGRKAIAPPAPRQALEASPANRPSTEAPEGTADIPKDAPPQPQGGVQRRVTVELSKSAALELVPVWREEGEEVGLAILAEADQKAKADGRKLTAATVRKVRKDWGASSTPEGGGKLRPSETDERAAVNKTLSDAAAAAEKLVVTLGKLDMDAVPPLNHAEAEKAAKALRTAGRWLTGHVKVPAEVVEAELVKD
ncbi:hypothetical protein [Streptomyces formicae]